VADHSNRFISFLIFVIKKGCMSPKPEDIAREQIDHMLVSAKWAVQDAKVVNQYAKQRLAMIHVAA
jgi:hypothetical protein